MARSRRTDPLDVDDDGEVVSAREYVRPTARAQSGNRVAPRANAYVGPLTSGTVTVTNGDQDVIRTCTRKKSYPSVEVAKRVAAAAASRGVQLRPYGCGHCGNFHVGLRPRSG